MGPPLFYYWVLVMAEMELEGESKRLGDLPFALLVFSFFDQVGVPL